MAAGVYDFVDEASCEQGATFTKAFDFFDDEEATDPQDLTGLNFRMQVRASIPATDVLAEFVSSGLTAEGDAPANGTITLGDDDLGNNNNRITLSMSAAQTALIEGGVYRYDIESVSSGGTPVVVRLLQGKFRVSPEVTRAA